MYNNVFNKLCLKYKSIIIKIVQNDVSVLHKIFVILSLKKYLNILIC